MEHRVPTIQVMMLPRDTNPQGTIFGGVLLSHIDLAGGVEARRSGNHVFVTRAMKEVVFHAPVFVGDIVSLYTRTLAVGRTSVTVEVRVEATRRDDLDAKALVTEAIVTYVAVDEARRPVPVRGPIP